MMSPHTSSTVNNNRTPPTNLRYQRPRHAVHGAESVDVQKWRQLPHDDVVPLLNSKSLKQPPLFIPTQSPRPFQFPHHSHNTGAPNSPVGIRKPMGSEGEFKKPRFLCLHGFRTNREIMRKQVGKWPESVLEKLDLVYLDAPFPAQGKSEVEGIFDPPYYEWFHFVKDFSEYPNLDKGIEYIEDYMIKEGPFDGFLGFSQGAILSAALPGLQAKGLALTKVPKIKFLIIIGGAKFKPSPVADDAYASPIDCPSLHFLGEVDFLKPHGLKLVEHCTDASIIHHPKGHTVPRLDEKGLETMMSFIEKLQKTLTQKDQ